MIIAAGVSLDEGWLVIVGDWKGASVPFKSKGIVVSKVVVSADDSLL